MICLIRLFTVTIVIQEYIKNAMDSTKIFWKVPFNLRDPKLRKSIFKLKMTQKKDFHVICVLLELEKEKILMILDA
jgi:hypothetical protein